MKIHIHHNKQSIAGFTLIEISLVIALILGLIAVAFMGVSAYKKGSDKAKCRMQLAQVQKAVRSMANMQGMEIGDTLASTDVFGAGKFVEVQPECPATGLTDTITYQGDVPAIGTAYSTCTFTDGDLNHALSTEITREW